MSHLEKYITYLRNVGHPVTLVAFDDDWSPIGPSVRAQLKAAGFTVELHGTIQLSPPSNTRGEIGEPSRPRTKMSPIFLNTRHPRITYQRTCQKCQGAGEIPWNDGTLRHGFSRLVKCQRCDGTGKVTITRQVR